MTRTHRVLIVGGGFGGLYAAKALKRAPVEVTLVDRANHHLFQPLLYEVATGIVTEGEIAPPLRGVLRRQENARVLLAEVDDFDLDERTVSATAPDGEPLTLGYDSLIVATGASGSRVLRAFEMAELAPDAHERAAWLRFAVVGGGRTGVELAGQIASLANRALRSDFRSIDTRRASISLLEAGPRLLPEFPEPLRLRAARELAQMGVNIWLRAGVTDVDDEGVDVGELRLPARTVIWAAGVRASPLAGALAQASGAPVDDQGRIAVEDDLTLPGHRDVFAIGDMAALDGVPGVAPAAMQQGRHAARTIRRRLADRPHRTISPWPLTDLSRTAHTTRRVTI
jgi:NADH:ubiquinone reductase (H+-translocating)